MPPEWRSCPLCNFANSVLQLPPPGKLNPPSTDLVSRLSIDITRRGYDGHGICGGPTGSVLGRVDAHVADSAVSRSCPLSFHSAKNVVVTFLGTKSYLTVRTCPRRYHWSGPRPRQRVERSCLCKLERDFLHQSCDMKQQKHNEIYSLPARLPCLHKQVRENEQQK